MMNVLEHEHPLRLIDLQVNNEGIEESEEEEEEENDEVTQDDFVCLYVPITLKHTSHSHPLILTRASYSWTCYNCVRPIKANEVSYACPDCLFQIDVCCATEPDKKWIHHPSHPHPLVPLIYNPILCCCNACGEKHEGIFFQCTTCANFAIHTDCAFLPKRLLIQQITNDIFHHTHPLTLSYSFPEEEQDAKYDPKCRICRRSFWNDTVWTYKCEKCIYYVHLACATATDVSKSEAFMSILSHPRGQNVRNFKDADYPDLFHLPFPDQTYSIHKQLFFEESGPTNHGTNKVSLQHTSNLNELVLVRRYHIDFEFFLETSSFMKCYNAMKIRELLCNGCLRPITELPFYKCGADEYYENESCNLVLHEWCTRLPTKVDNHPGYPQHTSHHHELVLINTKCIDGASSSSETISSMACHNPMKKIELLCSACVRPIMEMPFYKCGATEDESCNFALHEWCTRLPTQVDNHPGHPQHTLVLMSNVPGMFFNIFDCDVCRLASNGYAFGCVECHYYVDVTCGLIPEKITHKSHPDHLVIVKEILFRYRCIMCLNPFNFTTHSPILGFSCRICDVHIHPKCALFLPETIRHAYDQHPMKLSYLPIENHKSEYFCEICECGLNPHFCFYHCDKCAQSVHSACAPSILCCETETFSSYHLSSVHWFLNVKFGSIQKIRGHPHPLSFAQALCVLSNCSAR